MFGKFSTRMHSIKDIEIETKLLHALPIADTHCLENRYKLFKIEHLKYIAESI